MNVWKNQAFTVVELLVVIVVIGILASITVVSYGSVTDQARATDLSSAVGTVSLGFDKLAASQNVDTWLPETAFGSSGPNLTQLLNPSTVSSQASAELTELRRALPSGVPAVSGVEASWVYRNDGSVRSPTACDLQQTGPLLVLTGVPSRVAKKLDALDDDGQATCGKVRYDSSTLIYQLSFSQVMN